MALRTAADFRNSPVLGDAFSDHDVMTQMYDATMEQVVANSPDSAFEILDLLGTMVMGVPPMEWTEFEACLRLWQF